jgi:macrodomain Ter protein organizer (MatP/YcbG family)
MTKGYQIHACDQLSARRYIQKKLLLEQAWDLPVEAEISFERLKREAITISQWCQQWLDQAQWQRLQAALRASRYRQRVRQSPQRYGTHVHVRLDYHAWSILTTLAKRDGLTISAFILQHHQTEYLDEFDQAQQASHD